MKAVPEACCVDLFRSSTLHYYYIIIYTNLNNLTVKDVRQVDNTRVTDARRMENIRV